MAGVRNRMIKMGTGFAGKLWTALGITTSVVKNSNIDVELPTIHEKEKDSESCASLLENPKTKENINKSNKSKYSIVANHSNPKAEKEKRGRSCSMPFISLPLPVLPKTETAKICHENMMMTISGLYCNILVVLGMSFPVAEVLSSHVPASYYEAFYLYLYLGSLAYLFFIYITIIKHQTTYQTIRNMACIKHAIDDSKFKHESLPTNGRYGSFYLRMGAAAFGIGSMIYSGLEFGQYFELVRNVNCSNVLMAVTPALRMAFVIIQLQFIFMSDKTKTLTKYRIVSKLGLMHMIATNLCVWLNVLIQETKHEIIRVYQPNSSTTKAFGIGADFLTSSKEIKSTSIEGDFELSYNETESWMGSSLNRTRRGLHRPQELYECRRANIMGSLLQNAAPFLFPCTIEYSLISAVILYALWKNVCGTNKNNKETGKSKNKILRPVTADTSQYFTVDCANAHKGLFASLLELVFTIISLIMFFALIREESYETTAVFQVNLCELTLYVLSTLVTILAMHKIKYLPYEKNRHLELDTILLVMGQTGLYVYFMFSLIAGYFTQEIFTRPNIFVTAIFGIIQSSMQTLFIIDAWWRRCITPTSAKEKPARQLVTFLLISNLAMWAINHLENSRADFHPIELRFYGVLAWTIITHLSMPLAVFYRFHSTVCLCEIWKGTYKMRLHNELTKIV